jgi:phosphoglycerate kinase
MRVVDPDFIRGKRVVLRIDMDVPIKNGVVLEDLRLHAAMDTLTLCIQDAASTTVIGHIGRPNGQEIPEFSVKPVVEWIEHYFAEHYLDEGKLHVLENLRFEPGEDEASLDYAKELASVGDVFVNEAFAAHRRAASTTVLPTLLPSAAGLTFANEVDTLLEVRSNPKRPLVAIVGGVKMEDKWEAVLNFARFCDAVLVGGLLPIKVRESNSEVPQNVLLAELAPNGLDISAQSIELFKQQIMSAKQVIWAGPMGKYEDPIGNKGTLELGRAVIASGAESVIGGGDTITALKELLTQFGFVSTGGGAMLKLLTEGTLPTIEALKNTQPNVIPPMTPPAAPQTP